MTTLSVSYQYKRRIRWIVGVLSVLFVVGLLAVAANKLFVLKEITIAGDPIHISVDKNRLGQNLLFLQTEPLKQNLLSSYPLLGSVSFHKKFPSTLVIDVKLRDSFAILVSGGSRYGLDREGYVLPEPKTSHTLPEIAITLDAVSIGAKAQDLRVVRTLGFLRNLSEVQIEKVTERDSATLLATFGDTNIYLAQNDELPNKAGTLQTIVTGFRIKGALPSVIDLRYQKPIITN